MKASFFTFLILTIACTGVFAAFVYITPTIEETSQTVRENCLNDEISACPVVENEVIKLNDALVAEYAVKYGANVSLALAIGGRFSCSFCVGTLSRKYQMLHPFFSVLYCSSLF